jgi:hypothetical protein
MSPEQVGEHARCEPCTHGHEAGCGCGDCTIARCRRYEVPALREPRACALIACQIQTGPGMTWTNRTYEVIRAPDGWLVDFGEGRLEPRRDWAAVVRWLELLRPRDVEMMEICARGDEGRE